MRILMISGVPGKAEAGVAGIVYNLAKEVGDLGHSVKPIFFEDLLPQQKWPDRFRTIEFAKRISEYVREVRTEYDVINIHAPFGFWYGAQRRRRGSQAGPPYVMTMHGLEERRNYAMGREADKGRAEYFRWKNRVWQRLYHMPTYRWSFKTADQCIVTNREALLILQLHYNLPPDRVWFIANGVGPEFFHVRSFSGGIATKLLFVGTWIDHKGIYYLAEAFEKVLQVIHEARLTNAGCLGSVAVCRTLGGFEFVCRARNLCTAFADGRYAIGAAGSHGLRNAGGDHGIKRYDRPGGGFARRTFCDSRRHGVAFCGGYQALPRS